VNAEVVVVGGGRGIENVRAVYSEREDLWRIVAEVFGSDMFLGEVYVHQIYQDSRTIIELDGPRIRRHAGPW